MNGERGEPEELDEGDPLAVAFLDFFLWRVIRSPTFGKHLLLEIQSDAIFVGKVLGLFF